MTDWSQVYEWWGGGNYKAFAKDKERRIICYYPAAPREWVERTYDVERFGDLARGGHFAALEAPDALAEDLRAFFRPLRTNVR